MEVGLAGFFLLAGGLTVKRTWNRDSKEVRKGLDASDTRKIFKALDENWVITFPQGTTKPFAPGRKGTALIIKQVKYTSLLLFPDFGELLIKKVFGLKRKEHC